MDKAESLSMLFDIVKFTGVILALVACIAISLYALASRDGISRMGFVTLLLCVAYLVAAVFIG